VKDLKHTALSTFPTIASTKQGGGSFRSSAEASRFFGSGRASRFEKKPNRFANRAHEAEQPSEEVDEQAHQPDQVSEEASYVPDEELAEMEAYITEAKKRRAAGQQARAFC
jgi:hypothetical protein